EHQLLWHGNSQVMGTCSMVTRVLPDSQNAALTTSVSAVLTDASLVKDGQRTRASVRQKVQERLQLCGNMTLFHNLSPWPKDQLVSIESATVGHPKSTKCMAKGTPQMLLHVVTANILAFTSCSLSIIALITGATSACFFQHTLVTRRRGKKGLGSMLLSMLCPCGCCRGRKEVQPVSRVLSSDSDDSDHERSDHVLSRFDGE
ncbi:unnamed protein product, partial [Polarella glacialis]